MAKKKGALPGKKQQKTTQKNQTTTTKQETKKHKNTHKKKTAGFPGWGVLDPLYNRRWLAIAVGFFQIINFFRKQKTILFFSPKLHFF
jgi:hypothetical protein